MKKITLLAIIIVALISCQVVFAHSGRTDSSGGHNCSQKSKNKGLCYGYHNHQSVIKNKTPGVAAWTGKKERLQDGNGRWYWRCEYQIKNNKFWITNHGASCTYNYITTRR